MGPRSESARSEAQPLDWLAHLRLIPSPPPGAPVTHAGSAAGSAGLDRFVSLHGRALVEPQLLTAGPSLPEDFDLAGAAKKLVVTVAGHGLLTIGGTAAGGAVAGILAGAATGAVTPVVAVAVGAALGGGLGEMLAQILIDRERHLRWGAIGATAVLCGVTSGFGGVVAAVEKGALEVSPQLLKVAHLWTATGTDAATGVAQAGWIAIRQRAAVNAVQGGVYRFCEVLWDERDFSQLANPGEIVVDLLLGETIFRGTRRFMGSRVETVAARRKTAAEARQSAEEADGLVKDAVRLLELGRTGDAKRKLGEAANKGEVGTRLLRETAGSLLMRARDTTVEEGTGRPTPKQLVRAAGLYERAALLFEAAGDSEAMVMARTLLGRRLEAAGDFEGARRVFSSVEDKGAVAAAFTAEGEGLLRQGKYPEAAALFKMAGQPAGQARALRLMADAHLGAGERAQALRRLREAIAVHPPVRAALSQEILPGSGRMHYRSSQLEPLLAYAEALNDAAAVKGIQRDLGSEYQREGNLDGAITAFKAAGERERQAAAMIEKALNGVTAQARAGRGGRGRTAALGQLREVRRLGPAGRNALAAAAEERLISAATGLSRAIRDVGNPVATEWAELRTGLVHAERLLLIEEASGVRERLEFAQSFRRAIEAEQGRPNPQTVVRLAADGFHRVRNHVPAAHAYERIGDKVAAAREYVFEMFNRGENIWSCLQNVLSAGDEGLRHLQVGITAALADAGVAQAKGAGERAAALIGRSHQIITEALAIWKTDETLRVLRRLAAQIDNLRAPTTQRTVVRGRGRSKRPKA